MPTVPSGGKMKEDRLVANMTDVAQKELTTLFESCSNNNIKTKPRNWNNSSVETIWEEWQKAMTPSLHFVKGSNDGKRKK